MYTGIHFYSDPHQRHPYSYTRQRQHRRCLEATPTFETLPPDRSDRLPPQTMRAFISLSVIFRRTILILGLLLTLSYTLLAIIRTEIAEETTSRGYGVLDTVRKFNFGQGYIPVAFRPSTYLGTTNIQEPTTREEWDSLTNEEWESIAESVEGEEDAHAEHPKWTALKKHVENFIHRFSFTSLVLSRHPSRYETNWDNLPPNINAFKQWEYSRGVLYQGTGARMQRFLEKARSGKGFVVSVVGGSVSKGRGLPQKDWQPSGYHPSAHRATGNHDDRNLAQDWHIDPRPAVSQNLYNPLNLHHQIFQFLNQTFPVKQQDPGFARDSGGANIVSERKVDYSNPADSLASVVCERRPGWCRKRLLCRMLERAYSRGFRLSARGLRNQRYPVSLAVSPVLISLKLGVNRDLSSMENYELLLRSILEMKSQPAVLNLQ